MYQLLQLWGPAFYLSHSIRGESFDFTWGTAPGIVICGSERVKKVRQFVTGPEILYEPCQDVVCMLSLLITVIGSSEKEK